MFVGNRWIQKPERNCDNGQNAQAVQNVVEQAKQSRLLPESDNQKITAEYFQAKTDFYQFLDSLKTTHRSYYELKYGTTKITLEDTQKKLASTHSGMLMYYVGEEQLTSILITADSAWVNYQPIDSTFEETVNLFVGSIQSENQLSQYAETAAKLYNILLKPWKTHNRLPAKLSIVPEGVLLKIPFEALLTESPKESHAMYAREVYGLSINADEVVLSGCETGIGGQLSGEGVASLARAFTYAGAKSVVYTLWNIDDKSTANIMVDYWRNRDKTPKDQALTNAKAHYIRNAATHRMAHPRNWAGILISGNAESGN